MSKEMRSCACRPFTSASLPGGGEEKEIVADDKCHLGPQTALKLAVQSHGGVHHPEAADDDDDPGAIRILFAVVYAILNSFTCPTEL